MNANLVRRSLAFKTPIYTNNFVFLVYLLNVLFTPFTSPSASKEYVRSACKSCVFFTIFVYRRRYVCCVHRYIRISYKLKNWFVCNFCLPNGLPSYVRCHFHCNNISLNKPGIRSNWCTRIRNTDREKIQFYVCAHATCE